MSAHELGPPIGSGQVAEVFSTGRGVLKLYRTPGVKQPVLREANNLGCAARAGLPAPQLFGVVRVGDRWDLEMSRADGAPLADALQAGGDRIPAIGRMAALHHDLHRHDDDALPPLRDRLARNLGRAEALADDERDRLLAGIDRRGDATRICHYDFHPFNILGTREAPLIVDWADACRGDPAADVARSWMILALHLPQVAGAYLDAYLALSGRACEDIAAWVPLTAAARLSETVTDETGRLLEMARSTPEALADRMAACMR